MRAELRAAAIAALLVLFAAGIGLAVGARARAPAATPSPTAATPRPAADDAAAVQERALAQPLVAGCATGGAVWLFADGGSAIRSDGRTWSIPDPTLRSLLAAACREGTALAVGRAGSLLTVDDDRREVRADRFGGEDLHGVTLLPDGALAVGAAGTIVRQSALGWEVIAADIPEDLQGVAVMGRTGWIVGSGGASYRLEGSSLERVPTGTGATLRAVAMTSDGGAIAVGDGGTLLRWSGDAWSPVPAGVSAALRAVASVGAATWAVGDAGTALEILGDRVRRIDLGTACTLRAVFGHEADVWVVGSDGARGAAWRVTPQGTARWGSCG